MTRVRLNANALLFEIFITVKGMVKGEISIDGDMLMTFNEFGEFCDKFGANLAECIKKVAEVEESESN